MGIEVIGAGFGRTGNTSFREAMEILGFGKCYHMKEVIDHDHVDQWLRIADTEDPKLIRDLMDKGGYRSTCDYPACFFWQEQLKMYPNAKVVMTMRDADSWYKSWMDNAAVLLPDCETCPLGVRVFMGFVFYGQFAKLTSRIVTDGTFGGDLSKRNVIQSYHNHFKKVKFLCPPEKLLLFHAADGWEPLCTFLGVPIPDQPYPHANTTSEFRRFAFAVNAMGWAITIIGCGIPALYGVRGKISDPRKKSSNMA